MKTYTRAAVLADETLKGYFIGCTEDIQLPDFVKNDLHDNIDTEGFCVVWRSFIHAMPAKNVDVYLHMDLETFIVRQGRKLGIGHSLVELGLYDTWLEYEGERHRQLSKGKKSVGLNFN